MSDNDEIVPSEQPEQPEQPEQRKIYLVAVGMEIDCSGLNDILDKELPNSIGKRNPKLLSGVYYSETCSKQHTLQQSYARKPTSEMMRWFYRKKQLLDASQDDRAFIKELHISRNGRVCAGEVTVGTDKFFVFFYNERNVPTTMIKKELCQGVNSRHYQDNYHNVKFERVILHYRPYYHHLKDVVRNKHVIEYE